MNAPMELAGGSVTGRAHLNTGRNNQDAFHYELADGLAVGVVCDGCGSSARSEVGAALGARLVAAAVLDAARSAPDPDWCAVRARVLQTLGTLARGMGGPLERIVDEYLLFTVVGALVTPARTWVFSVGDGIYAVNGDETRLGPFPRNEPPYLGYALLGMYEAETELRVDGPWVTAEVESLLIGSDGAADLARPGTDAPDEAGLRQFWSDDRFFNNRDGVRRRLAVLNRGRGGASLPDDTTLVVMRRRRAALQV